MVPLDFLVPNLGRGICNDEAEEVVDVGDDAAGVSDVCEITGAEIVGVISDIVILGAAPTRVL